MIVKFTSFSTEDIFDIKSKKCWTTPVPALKVKPGTVVYVVPNAEERKKGKMACVVAIATESSSKIEPQRWPSSGEGTPKYVNRIPLTDIEEVHYSSLPEEIKNARVNLNGVRYIESESLHLVSTDWLLQTSQIEEGEESLGLVLLIGCSLENTDIGFTLYPTECAALFKLKLTSEHLPEELEWLVPALVAPRYNPE